MEALVDDLRHAVGALVRARRISAVAVLLLGLALGATASISAVVFSLLVGPLPVPGSRRVVLVFERSPTGREPYTSYVNFSDWAAGSRRFGDLAAVTQRSFDVVRNGEAKQLTVGVITRDFFQVLRVKTIAGRGFDPTDTEPVCLVSRRLWEADPSILGGTLQLATEQVLVIGVLPKPMETLLGPVDMWVPLESAARWLPPQELIEPGYLSFTVVGRLRDGVDIGSAKSEMERVARRIADADPRRTNGVDLVSLREYLTQPGTGRAVVLLAGAVALMLLVAVANASNLLLALLASRENELTIRRALGATHGRILRGLALEGFLLSGAASIVALGVSYTGMRLLEVAQLPSLMPFALRIGPWGAAMQFAVAAVTGILVNSSSAVQLVRQRHRGIAVAADAALRSDKTSAERLRSALVACQIAFSVVLLVGTALMLRTVFELLRVPMVERPQGLLQVRVSLPQDRYPYTDLERQRVYREEILPRVAALPGVQEVAAATSIPVPNSTTPRSIWLADGRRFLNGDRGAFPWTPGKHTVTPGHFRILGIPLLEGRDFREDDNADSPRVAIVNERLAAALWPGSRALGKRLKFSRDEPWYEVVGVVGGVAYKSPRNPSRPEVYVPMSQQPSIVFWILVRGSADAAQLRRPVLEAVRAVDPLVPVLDAYTASEALAGVLLETRCATWLLAVLGVTALVISAVGVFALMSYAVVSRAFEFGVRRALGARASTIWSLILSRVAWIVAIGLGAGLLGAVCASRFLGTVLFGVRPNDGATLVVVGIAVSACCFVAVVGPATRAATVDPAIALRHH